MENNIGDPELINKLNELTIKMSQGVRLMAKYGKELAEAERAYKVELHEEVLRLKSRDMAATLIQKCIYGSGKVPELRFKRDLAQTMYDTSKENINVLKLQARLLESQIDREWKS